MADVNIRVNAKDNATSKIERISDAWLQLATPLNQTIEIARRVGEAIRAVNEDLQEAARAEATARTFDSLASSIGVVADSLRNDLKAATSDMVGELDLMKAANQFMAMGLGETQDEVARLAEIGTTLGLAFRGDAAAGMEEFALLLANQSIPRLDTFGISAGRVRARIAELTEANADLSREQAFLQAVMAEADITMGNVGDQAEGAAGNLARLNARMDDMKLAAQQGKADGLGPLLQTMDDLSGSTENTSKFIRDFTAGLYSLGAVGAQTEPEVGSIADAVKALNENGQLFTLENFITPVLIARIARVRGDLQDLARMHEAAGKGAKEQADEIEDLDDTNQELIRTSGGVADAYIETALRIRENAESTRIAKAAAEDALRVDEMRLENIERTRDAAGRAARAHQEMVDALRAEEAAMGDAFTEAVEFNKEVDPMAQRLYDAADAANASQETLALLGVGLGLFSEEAAIAAIKLAATEAKVRDLGKAVADGDITIGDAIQMLQDFQAEMDNLDPSGVVEAADTAAGALGRIVGDHYIRLHVEQYGEISAGMLGNPGGHTLTDGMTPPGRAEGGPVYAGRPYIVGERGPEMFVPTSSGQIVPNDQMGGGVSVTIGSIVVPAHMAGNVANIAAAVGDRIGRSLRG